MTKWPVQKPTLRTAQNTPKKQDVKDIFWYFSILQEMTSYHLGTVNDF